MVKKEIKTLLKVIRLDDQVLLTDATINLPGIEGMLKNTDPNDEVKDIKEIKKMIRKDELIPKFMAVWRHTPSKISTGISISYEHSDTITYFCDKEEDAEMKDLSLCETCCYRYSKQCVVQHYEVLKKKRDND